MAQKTDAELTTEADVIGNETTASANTADRVRDMLISLIDSKQNNIKLVTALVDAATIDLSGPVHTLATSSATRTFTISYTGDDIVLEITLSATASTLTFPVASLCISEASVSGDNTCALSGTSGDVYMIAIKKVGSNYRVVCKNFGQ